MAQYHNITADEMGTFLGDQGFQRIDLQDGTRELVWGKIVYHGRQRLSLRIYTGINPTGESRGVGKDAIRVKLFYKADADADPVAVGGSKRVHRVEGWRNNLQDRIDKWEEAIGPSCPKCHAPMIQKTVKKDGANKGRKFFSCCTWKQTQCNGFQWAT